MIATDCRPLRALLAILMFALLIPETQASAWDDFLREFVSKDGRVIDTGNGGISHSEGQGYGMIFAEAHDDVAAFDRIWTWTRKNLQTRDDALLSWKWEPENNGGTVTDRNNATDGDILVAWALFRAADRWKTPEYRAAAKNILESVLEKTIVPSPFGPLIRPAATGFDKPEGGLVVNLSYWVFPAFRTFAREDPRTDWMAISASGRKLLEKAKFGRWELPPDWMLVSGSKVSLGDMFPPDFGYNAVRIPMHLVWDGVTEASWFVPYRAYRASFPEFADVKATVNLEDNNPGENPILPGMARIYTLAGVSGPAGEDFTPVPADASLDGQPYFSAALSLLAEQAFKEGLSSPSKKGKP
jgi:endoglucanase